MGRGAGSTQEVPSVGRNLAGIDGWRFFVWEGPEYRDGQEHQIGPDSSLARIATGLQKQIAEKLGRAGLEPLSNVDLCFFQGPDQGQVGLCSINAERRIQILLRADPAMLEDRDWFIQVFCHEYCHALFLQAEFAALSPDDRPRFADEHAETLIESRRPGDTLASEAIADLFALAMHSQIRIGAADDLLSHEELLSSENEYDDSLDLKRVLASAMLRAESADGPQPRFIYSALQMSAQATEASLFERLCRSVEEDRVINPQGLSFADFYERERALILSSARTA